MDVRRLRVLAEVGERGSIAAAAQVLHLTPSAVSQQLATLSREAGVPLLAKAGRGIRLTDQARILLKHAAIVSAQLERAQSDLQAHRVGLVGEVRIGAFASAISGLIAPVLPKLLAQRPEVAITVVETDSVDWLATDLNVVVIIDSPRVPPLTDRRYVRRFLQVDPFDLLVADSHPAAHQDATALIDHRDAVWIGDTAGACREAAVAACTTAGFTPEFQHQTGDWTAVAALVAAGSGIALVPRLALSHLPSGTRRIPVFPPAGRTILALVRAGSEDSPLLLPILTALTSGRTRSQGPEECTGPTPSP